MDFYRQKLVLWFVPLRYKIFTITICLFSLVGCSPVLHLGAGAGYVQNIPTSHLTGHEQFHLKVEVEQPITDNLSFYGGWNHYSNGAQIGIGRYPNYGLDFLGARVEAEFHLW